MLRTSLRLNNDLSPSQFVELALAAERSGFDQLWLSHDLFLHSAPVLLAAAAVATTTIQLGTGVLNPYSAHPVELAMHATSLQELSGGRALLGIAAGAAEFLDRAGIEQHRPLGRTREALLSCRALLDGERPATVYGAGAWTPSARLLTPASQRVPIYLGAMSPKMSALAGELADGALALLYPPEHFPTAFAQIEQGRREAGREEGSVDIPACVWVSVDHDPERAAAPLAEKLAYYGAAFAPYLLERAGLTREEFAPAAAAVEVGDLVAARAAITPAMLRLGIAGTPDDVVKRCRWLMDEGATHVSFGPPLGPDPVAAVELLGKEVLPALRGYAEHGDRLTPSLDVPLRDL